jgi:hypothetical protein
MIRPIAQHRIRKRSRALWRQGDENLKLIGDKLPARAVEERLARQVLCHEHIRAIVREDVRPAAWAR